MHKLIMGTLLAIALAIAGPAVAADQKGSATQRVQIVKNEQSSTVKSQSKARGYFFSTEIWVTNLSSDRVQVIAGGWNAYVYPGVTTYHEFLPPSSYEQYFRVYDNYGFLIFSGYLSDGETLVIYDL